MTGMDLGRAFHVPVLAERHLTDRLIPPVSAPEGGWLVAFKDHPDVHLLDPQLNVVLTLELGGPRRLSWRERVAPRGPEGGISPATGHSELHVVSHRGLILHRIEHPRWPEGSGRCFFDARGRVWYAHRATSPASTTG